MRYILIILALFLIGCGESEGGSVVNNHYLYNDYSIHQIQVICDQMNDGDVYDIDDEIGGSIVKNNGDCYLRIEEVIQ